MTYWTLIPAIEDRGKVPSKVIKQLSKPNPATQRVKNYPWIHGFNTKNAAIDHFNKMEVPNGMRPLSFKSYDFRAKPTKPNLSSLEPQDEPVIIEG